MGPAADLAPPPAGTRSSRSDRTDPAGSTELADVADPTCSIARALGIVGDRWTILILRDALINRTGLFGRFLGGGRLAGHILIGGRLFGRTLNLPRLDSRLDGSLRGRRDTLGSPTPNERPRMGVHPGRLTHAQGLTRAIEDLVQRGVLRIVDLCEPRLNHPLFHQTLEFVRVSSPLHRVGYLCQLNKMSPSGIRSSHDCLPKSLVRIRGKPVPGIAYHECRLDLVDLDKCILECLLKNSLSFGEESQEFLMPATEPAHLALQYAYALLDQTVDHFLRIPIRCHLPHRDETLAGLR